jgi:lipoprotein-anchoring transpeptidase ErfK/SrfK
MQTPTVRAALLVCALSCAWPLSAAPPTGIDGTETRAPAATTPTVAAPKPAAAAAPKPAAPATAAPKASAKPAKSTKSAAPPPRLPVLKAGEYRWWPELAPEGPMVMVVSLPEQRLYVYRNGVRIGVSTVSTGRRGFETQTGVFPILEREREHFSNLYDNAPMPFMLRLTWSGTALHAGKIPGYPASHGCIRLPAAFAETLYDASRRGVIVVVADTSSQPPEVVSPEWLAPVETATGAVRDASGDTSGMTSGDALAASWTPERAPEGPLTAILSTSDRMLVVLRNGIEIGHANAEITGEPAKGTRIYTLRADAGDEARTTADSPLPDPPPTLRWQAMAMPGKTPAPGVAQPPLRGGQIRVSGTFAQQLQAALPADPTLVITDEALRHVRPVAPPIPAAPAVPAPPAAPQTDETAVTSPLPPPPQTPPLKP